MLKLKTQLKGLFLKIQLKLTWSITILISPGPHFESPDFNLLIFQPNIIKLRSSARFIAPFQGF